MDKRIVIVLLVVVALLAGALPVMAQDTPLTGADYVPADFAGFLRLRMDDPADTLRALNFFAFTGLLVQPERVNYNPQQGIGYGGLLPLDAAFDIENTSFVQNVLPFAGGEVIIAYPQFDGALNIGADEWVMIVPTEDVFTAAAQLRLIIEGQDLPQQETHRDTTLYIGDKTTLALADGALLIGSTDLIKAALDAAAGERERISDLLAYQQVRAAAPENPSLWGYVTQDYLLAAVNGALNGDADSQALLAAFGGALSQTRGEASFESRLLDGGFDGAGMWMTLSEDLTTVQAAAAFHPISTVTAAADEFNADLLNFIPRNALLVHTGADLSALLSDGLTALPMTNFARQMLGGFAIETVGTASDLIDAPSADAVVASVNTFVDVVNEFDNFDLRADLLAHVEGSYALALLPRPNNPAPILNTPFDLLLVTQTAEAEAAAQGVTTLLSALFNLQAAQVQTDTDWTFVALASEDSRDPAFIIGTLDDRLIITTGDAVQAALAAERGDNRLTAQESWQALSTAQTPDLYVDMTVLLNTFFPTAGGFVINEDSRTRLGLNVDVLANGVTVLNVNVSVPN
ncbi:MAG: DUF3352 domain-containing protein [Anaerolineae bacterium]|nr:DUF3352 domain-containing protein [Anaerolineae bacterium]